MKRRMISILSLDEVTSQRKLIAGPHSRYIHVVEYMLSSAGSANFSSCVFCFFLTIVSHDIINIADSDTSFLYYIWDIVLMQSNS